LVSQAQKVLIVGHLDSDEDSVASCLAIDYYLRKKFPSKKVTLLLYPPLPHWLADFQTSSCWITQPEEIKREPDLLILLDGDDLDRFFSRPLSWLKKKQLKTVRIDHHPGKSNSFSLLIVDPKAAATSQIIAEALFFDFPQLDKSIVKLLLIGILGDTGGFRYINPDCADFLTTVEWLVKRGRVDVEQLLVQLGPMEKKELELIGLLIKNTRFVNSRKTPPFCYSFLPESVLDQGFGEKIIAQARRRYLSFFVRRIRGYPWGFVLFPREKGVLAVSFRSMGGGVDVRKLAREFFAGGGHVRASAGTVKIRRGKNKEKRACQKVIKIIRTANLQVIN